MGISSQLSPSTLPSSPQNQSVCTGVNHYFNHTVQNEVHLFYHSSINPNGTRALQPPLLLSSHHLFSLLLFHHDSGFKDTFGTFRKLQNAKD